MWKILRNIKDNQNKASIDNIWKRFLSMSERETTRQGTTESLVKNKDELIRILEALETDNMLMYAAEDGQVILI